MAVNIEEFKRDLDQLKSQRSVVQAKLDEAVKHANEIEQTLKSFGYNSVEEAEQAYARQCVDAERQHEQVKKLIMEIQSLDTKLPTREEVAQRLQALSVGQVELIPQVVTQDVLDQPVPSSETTTNNNTPVQVPYVEPDKTIVHPANDEVPVAYTVTTENPSGLMVDHSGIKTYEDGTPVTAKPIPVEPNPILESVVQLSKDQPNVTKSPEVANSNVDLGNILFSSLN